MTGAWFPAGTRCLVGTAPREHKEVESRSSSEKHDQPRGGKDDQLLRYPALGRLGGSSAVFDIGFGLDSHWPNLVFPDDSGAR